MSSMIKNLIKECEYQLYWNNSLTISKDKVEDLEGLFIWLKLYSTCKSINTNRQFCYILCYTGSSSNLLLCDKHWKLIQDMCNEK